MKKITGVTLMLMLMLVGTQAFGSTITFGDNTNYWPGWSTLDPNNPSKNTSDTWGNPDILGGTATITNGYLTQVTFNVQSTNGSDWSLLKPADLFIDTNNDKTWDYVVNMIGGNNNAENQGLYAIDQPLYNTATNGNYILSNSILPSLGSGYNIGSLRDNQPIAVNNLSGSPIDTVTFGGWPGTLGTSQTTAVSFNFGAQDILVGSQFDIGWTTNCGNDELYETVNNPVPEPASMLLLGSGLIGLAGWGRKKFFKKEAAVTA